MLVAGVRTLGGNVETLEVDDPRTLAADEVLIDVRGAGVGNWDNIVRCGGWDVGASMDSGTLRTGTSRWTAGEGEFTIANRAVTFDSLTLENSHVKTRLDGAIDFSQQLQLTFAPAPAEKRAAKSAAAPRLFQLRGPMEKPVAAVQLTPVAQARRQQ